MPVIKKGSTDVSRYVMLRDSTAGTPETGYTITSLDLQYTRNQSTPAAKVDATALAATNTAHTDNYAIQVDATSSPGLYRIDWPDAAFATGADKVLLVVSGTGLDPAVEEIELVNYDPADAVRLGLTALPNAAADAAGGLPISDAGGLDLDNRMPSATSITNLNTVFATDFATNYNTTSDGWVVKLGDYAHGGTAGVLTLSRIIAASATTNEPAIKLTGNGTAAGILSTGGASSGAGMSLQSGGGDGSALVAVGTGLGNGIYLAADAGGVGLGIAATSGISTNGAVSFNSFTPNFANNVITAASINADAFTAAKFASDVTTEFQSGLATASALTTLSNRLTGLVLATGTIGSTGNDTTHLHLDGLTYGDDEINNWLLVIFDVSTSEYHSRWIEDWVLSTELATVATLPFTPQNATDTYWLLPVRQDVTGGSGLDAAGVRAAIGLASANLDTQLTAIDDYLDTEVAALTTELAKVPKSDGTATWNATALASIQTEANDALVANNLDHLLLSAVDTNFATTVHLNSVIGHLADDGTTATFDRTTDSLEAFYNAFNARLTTARGGYLDNLNIGGNVASSSALSSLTDVVNAMGDNITIIDSIVDDILLDTAEIGTAGAGLTNINLPNQTMDIVGNITGNLSGSVGSVTGNVTGSVGSISGVTFPSNFAALGINASGHVSRVTLTDTLTTYTGNTAQTGDAYGALTSAVPDSVPADGSRPTVQQAVRMILQVLTEGGISGTTWTVKKEDGSTTLMTVTLDADPPTSKTRSG